VRKRADFVRIQGTGVRVDTRRFVLVLAAQSAPGPTRLGITASHRIGNAVARNRAKRLVREAFREVGTLFAAGLDLVVIVRKPLGDAGLSDVVREWQAASKEIRRRSEKLLGLASGHAGPKNGDHPKGS